MRFKRIALLSNIALFLPLLASLVYAGFTDPISSVLSVFGDFNVYDIYQNYWGIIDFILYLIIFIGLSQQTLGRRFQGRASSSISTGIGIALAIAAAFGARQFNFRLGDMAPIALLIFILLIAMEMAYVTHRLIGDWKPAIAAAFLLTYFAINAVAPFIMDWLRERVPFIASVFSILVIIALISVFAFVLKIRRSGGGATMGDVARGAKSGWRTGRDEHAAKVARKKALKQEDEANKDDELSTKLTAAEIAALNAERGPEHEAWEELRREKWDVDRIKEIVQRVDQAEELINQYQQKVDAAHEDARKHGMNDERRELIKRAEAYIGQLKDHKMQLEKAASQPVADSAVQQGKKEKESEKLQELDKRALKIAEMDKDALEEEIKHLNKELNARADELRNEGVTDYSSDEKMKHLQSRIALLNIAIRDISKVVDDDKRQILLDKMERKLERKEHKDIVEMYALFNDMNNPSREEAAIHKLKSTIGDLDSEVIKEAKVEHEKKESTENATEESKNAQKK